MVRASDYLQRRVVGSDIIHMNAQRDHPGRNLVRWLNMRLPRFHRPWAEPIDLDTLLDCNRSVLVPTELPIRVRRFVEQDGAHRLCFWIDQGTSDLADSAIGVQQMSYGPYILGGQAASWTIAITEQCCDFANVGWA